MKHRGNIFGEERSRLVEVEMARHGQFDTWPYSPGSVWEGSAKAPTTQEVFRTHLNPHQECRGDWGIPMTPS